MENAVISGHAILMIAEYAIIPLMLFMGLILGGFLGRFTKTRNCPFCGKILSGPQTIWLIYKHVGFAIFCLLFLRKIFPDEGHEKGFFPCPHCQSSIQIQIKDATIYHVVSLITVFAIAAFVLVIIQYSSPEVFDSKWTGVIAGCSLSRMFGLFAAFYLYCFLSFAKNK